MCVKSEWLKEVLAVRTFCSCLFNHYSSEPLASYNEKGEGMLGPFPGTSGGAARDIYPSLLTTVGALLLLMRFEEIVSGCLGEQWQSPEQERTCHVC